MSLSSLQRPLQRAVKATRGRPERRLLPWLLAGVIGLLSPSLQAESLEVAGMSTSRDISCSAADTLSIRGVEHRLTVRGPCQSIEISGMGHRISFEEADYLEIAGTKHQITGGSVSRLNLSGQSNRLVATIRPAAAERVAAARQKTATGRSEPKDAAPDVEVAGVNQILELSLTGPTRLLVSGARNQVAWTRAAGIADPSLKVMGSHHTLRRRH